MIGNENISNGAQTHSLTAAGSVLDSDGLVVEFDSDGAYDVALPNGTAGAAKPNLGRTLLIFNKSASTLTFKQGVTTIATIATNRAALLTCRAAGTWVKAGPYFVTAAT